MFVLALAFAATAPLLTAPAPPLSEAPWQEAFARAADKELQQLEGDDVHPAAVGAFVIDVERGTFAAFEGDRRMVLASAMKVFILMEAYRQREEGTLSFQETLPYTQAFIRDGAPTMNKERLGTRLRVEDLLTFMIRDSDNAATDMMLARLRAKRVQQSAQEFAGRPKAGLRKETELGSVGPVGSMLHARLSVYRQLDPRADQLSTVDVRDVRWRNGYHPRLDLLKQHIGPPYGRYGEDDLDRAFAVAYARGHNTASMRAMAQVFLALTERRVVSAEASGAMLHLLSHTATSDRRVEGALPDGVPVAHKTGTSHKRVCDAGVITLPDGTSLVVAIAVAGKDREKSEDVIARLSRTAYELVIEAHRTPAAP